MTQNEVGCSIDNNNIENIMYGIQKKWAQIAFLTGKELQLAQMMFCDRENDNLFGFEILNKIIDNGGKFLNVEPKNIKANDIDSFKDIQLIRKILK